jgi:hypothetical protein
VCPPGVAFPGEPVRGLAQQGRLGRQLCDPSLHSGEFGAGGGDLVVNLDQLGGRVRGIGDPAEPEHHLVPLLAAHHQGPRGLRVDSPGGRRRGLQSDQLGMGLLHGPASHGVECSPQRRAVIGPVGVRSEPVGIGGQRRQVGPPGVPRRV